MSEQIITDVKKISVTYDDFGRLMQEMVKILTPIKDEFVAVHGLPRGGLAIATHISHFLNLPFVLNITQFKNEHPIGKLLVVDDIVDTGRTFERFLEIAALKHIQFETAVLFYKPHTEYVPTYYIRETMDWICFPWEPLEEKPNREKYIHLGGSVDTINSDLDFLEEE